MPPTYRLPAIPARRGYRLPATGYRLFSSLDAHRPENNKGEPSIIKGAALGPRPEGSRTGPLCRGEGGTSRSRSFRHVFPARHPLGGPCLYRYSPLGLHQSDCHTHRTQSKTEHLAQRSPRAQRGNRFLSLLSLFLCASAPLRLNPLCLRPIRPSDALRLRSGSAPAADYRQRADGQQAERRGLRDCRRPADAAGGEDAHQFLKVIPVHDIVVD